MDGPVVGVVKAGLSITTNTANELVDVSKKVCVADSAVYVPAGFTSLNSTGMDSDRGGPIAHRTPWRHDGLGLRTVDLETPRALLLGFEAADLDRGDCCWVFKNHSGVVGGRDERWLERPTQP